MSEVKALVIQADGNAEVTAIPGTLENLQSLVGGYIEPVRPSAGPWLGWLAYADEDGKSKRLPVNEVANFLLTSLGWVGSLAGDFLVGTVVVLGFDGSPDETDVPGFVIDAAKDFYRKNGGVGQLR